MTELLLPAATVRGRQLNWRGGPLFAAHPAEAWSGVLAQRGLNETDPFFAPRLADLPDPFAMQDLQKGAARLLAALRCGEPIHIFGDFDCDGCCGTAILLDGLRGMGGVVTASIPHRSDDGHGIDPTLLLSRRAEGVMLGLSVDTGVSSFAAAEAAKSCGMDLIVADHHLPEATLPDVYALLDPARDDCGFADRKLCGAGVAFFLLLGIRKLASDFAPVAGFDLRQLLDRVAIATVADVMPLLGVNRTLVHHGLKQMATAPSPGVAALLTRLQTKSAPTVQDIGYQIAPRINAAGRMRHGDAAMRLLCCTDPMQAKLLADELDACNAERRKVEAATLTLVEQQLSGDAVLAAYSPHWHAGVVGLVAGRLARKHGRPAAVGFVTPDGSVRLSLRSGGGGHIGQILQQCGSCLLEAGGHAGAGGATLKPEMWRDFIAAFAAACASSQRSGLAGEPLGVDGLLEPTALHPGLVERTDRLEPCGIGNPPCTWLLRGVTVVDVRPLRGGTLRLQLLTLGCNNQQMVQAVAFRATDLTESLTPGSTPTLVGQLQFDSWRGGRAVQFVVEDVVAG